MNKHVNTTLGGTSATILPFSRLTSLGSPARSAKIVTYGHSLTTKSKLPEALSRVFGDVQPDTLFFSRRRYKGVEYLNSPHGLIVLAHRKDIWSQVDGIHPATLSHTIDHPNNIVEPLPMSNKPGNFFNFHWMDRKSPGVMIHHSFGEKVGFGDPRAPNFSCEAGMNVEFYFTPENVVAVAIYEGRTKVHFIEPVGI